MTARPGGEPAVDCHAHCYDLAAPSFSETSGFHVQPNETGSAEDYAAVLDAHGLSHAVLVNPLGGYGTDNSYMLRTLAASRGRFKGIALLSAQADDREVAALHEGGVVGIRFNLNFAASPSLFGAAGERALGIARERDWLIQIHYSGDTIVAALPVLRASGRTVIIDHCGRPDVGAGLDQPGFSDLLKLGREGNTHIKLSAFFRMSASGPPYADCTPFARALVEAFTIDRCLWGSDWPFIRVSRRVDYGPQLAFLETVVPSAEQREKILWDNPARLFGFAETDKAV